MRIMKVGNENIEKSVLEQTKILLLKYGVKGWNMNDLAISCSMSKRTLYKIIGSKEELLHKMIFENINENICAIEACFNKNTPFDQLLEDWKKYTIIGFKGYILVDIKMMHFEYPAIANMIDKLVSKQENKNRQLLELGIACGYFVENNSIDIYLKMLRAIIDYNINNYEDDKQFQQDCYDMLGTFFNGITKV